MSESTLLDAIRFLDTLLVSNVVFIGGEPTVSDLLCLAIAESIAKGMEPTVVTNGRRLADKTYAETLHDAGLRKLSISVESCNPDKHDWITRRTGSYIETVAGIKTAMEYGMMVDTVTTISYDNLSEIAQMIHWAKSLGVKSVGFNVETPNIDTPVASELTVKATVDKMSELLGLANTEGIDVHFAASIPLCLLPEPLQQDNHFRGSCFVYYGNGLVIDANGGIIPCVHWIAAEIDSIYSANGNVKTADEFLDGWNNGLPKEFRDKLWRYPATSCITCHLWDVGKCTGGCPLLRLSRDLSLEIDPLRESKEVCQDESSHFGRIYPEPG